MIFNIGAKLNSSFAPTINQTQTALNKFNQEMIEINKVQNEMKGFQNIQKDMIETRNKVNATKTELSRLQEELRKNPTNKLRGEVKKTAENLENLEGKLKSQIGKYGELKNSLIASGVNTKKLRSEYERLSQEFINVEKSQNKYLKNQKQAQEYEHKRNKMTSPYQEIYQQKFMLPEVEQLTFDGKEKSFLKLRAQMIEINKVQNEMKGFQNIQKDMVETRNKIITTKTELSRLKEELRKNPSDKLRGEVKKTAENLENLEDKLKSQIGKYGELKKSLTSSGVNVKKLRQEYERLGKEFTEIEKKQNRYLKIQEIAREKAKKWNKINPVSIAKSFALAAPVIGSAKLAIDDSKAFSDVKKQSGLGGKELEEFKYQILEATRHIPMLNGEIYALSAQALQSGVPISEMAQFTSDAATMATAFDIEAAEAAKTMATWRSAFGMAQPEVMKLADVINYLGNNLATTPKDLTLVVNGVASLGKLAGVSEKQTAALAAQIMANGKNADITKTGLKNMFLTLAAGASATNRQKDAYKKLGLTSAQVAQGMQEDAQGMLLEVLESVKALDEVERAAVLSDLFGKESIEIVAALNTDVEKLKLIFRDVSDETKYTNSAMEEFNSKLEDPNTQLELAKKAMLQTGINAGNVLLPHIVTIAQKTGEFFNWISQVQRENPMLLKGVMLLATTLIGINATVGVSKFLFGNILSTGFKIYDNWENITGIISKGKDLLPMVSGGFSKIFGLVSKMNFAMLMNPWVIGIGAVIGAGYLLIKNWDTVKEWFKSFVGYVGNLFKWLWEHSPLKLIIDGAGKVYDKLFGKKDTTLTQSTAQNITQQIQPLPDLNESSNALIKREEIKMNTSNTSVQFTIHQKVEYMGDNKKISPDVEKKLREINKESFEKAMQEYERKNKRLGFNR